MSPTEELLQQFRNANYLLEKYFNIANDFTTNSHISIELKSISESLDKLNTSFDSYQSAITSQAWFSFVVGSLVTIIATWFYDFLKERKKTKDYLFNLQRMVVDQVNMILEIEDTIDKFIHDKLDDLIKRVRANIGDVYSVDAAFFPLFSARSMSETVNEMSSGSNYLDNKVGKIYSLSKDLPFIVEDLRMQFKETLERNEKIAFAKLNSAPVQKEQFIDNLLEFRRVLKSDMLEKNIPLYLKMFTEALVIIREKTNRHPIAWKIIHDPRFKFYWRNEIYVNARSGIVNAMDKYFSVAAEKQLKEINVLRKLHNETDGQNK